MIPLCSCGRRRTNMGYRACSRCRYEQERKVRLARPLCACGERRPTMGRIKCSVCREKQERYGPCAMCGAPSYKDLCHPCAGSLRCDSRRRRVIERLRDRGMTLTAIGQKFGGITRQRVEQILHWPALNARAALHRAVKSGRLKKPPFCQRCEQETQDLEAHHDDYSKPLDVQWLCVPCHTTVHPHHPYVRRGAKAVTA